MSFVAALVADGGTGAHNPDNLCHNIVVSSISVASPRSNQCLDQQTIEAMKDSRKFSRPMTIYCSSKKMNYDVVLGKA